MPVTRSPLFVLPLAAATTVAAVTAASAADVAPIFVAPPLAPIVVEQDEWHFHVEGGPVFSSARITVDPADKFGAIPPDRGFYVGAALRHQFVPKFSWQIAGTGTWLSGPLLVSQFGDATLLSSMTFQTIDADIGFHPSSDLHNRIFVGVRVLHSTDFLEFDVPFYDYSISTGEMWAYGPRVGVNLQTPVGNGNVSLIADLSGSVLFGDADVLLSAPYIAVDASGSRVVYNAEGQVGIAFNPSPAVSIAFGYRAQQWWGIRQATEVQTIAGFVEVDTDKLIHGPFARLAIDF